MAETYGTYIQIDKLLSAQRPLANGEHDEMLFIIIHQTYELWFKQILTEGDLLIKLLYQGDLDSSLATFKRVLAILKLLVQQTDILETMTPLSFASFRNRLDNASGLQSYQFRLVEFFLGLKDANRLSVYPEDSVEYQELRKGLTQPSIYDAFLHFLEQKVGPGAIPKEVLARDLSKRHESNDTIIATLEGIYRQKSPIVWLCEKMVDLDEGLQEWRYRHVKMVERTIGMKMGTGGSLGVHYLKNSLFNPAFPELWLVRNRF